jgi:inhibitor of cysteine peptidase
MIIYIFVITMMVACASSPETQESATSENPEGGSSSLAMVDAVTLEQRENHYYAVINGFYPDACTKVSSVEQVVEENTISITLLTDRPPDLMCAAMLTPFNIDVLLTTGGLMPQEYNVVVNEGPSTTFLLE